MTTALSQLVLKRVLAATEEQQNNELYPSINIGVGIVKGDVGQPNILVSLDKYVLIYLEGISLNQVLMHVRPCRSS